MGALEVEVGSAAGFASPCAAVWDRPRNEQRNEGCRRLTSVCPASLFPSDFKGGRGGRQQSWRVLLALFRRVGDGARGRKDPLQPKTGQYWP